MGMALVTKCVTNIWLRKVINFIVQDTAALMAKLGTRQNASVYRGEWAYHTCSEAFKDKARLQNFGLNNFVMVLF